VAGALTETVMAQGKERLDKLLVDRGLAATRSRARSLIMAGEVLVNGQREDKPGTAVSVEASLEVIAPALYVSRGGFKLAAALEAFQLTVNGRICADVGACTGGFTDVLLQQGATRVYAIDVGYGQLDWKLRQDPRVVVMERTNARYLESLPEMVEFVCIDVSFISVRYILPAMRGWLAREADVVVLIKPQFEAGPSQVGKGGVVREVAVHREVLEDLLRWAEQDGWAAQGLIRSPIHGADGNVEFLLWIAPGGKCEGWDARQAIDSVL
jgi:23S rRNA (cytidine1920-2'-O)/16S rRNA (cytidine1409-2'-O)-methyltransferase